MLISTSRVKIQKSHCFWNSKKQQVLALMNSPWVFITRNSIPNHPSVSQTAMSTLYFSSPFAGLVHCGTLMLLLNWSVLLFAAAALELCCSCCQSDSTSHVFWTEFATVFIWLSQTFSFQRSHMHQNIMTKVFKSCIFSPCTIRKKPWKEKKQRLMMKFCIFFQRPATHHTSSSYWQQKNTWHSYFSLYASISILNNIRKKSFQTIKM